MPRFDSSLNMLILAAVLALGVGYYVPQTFTARPTEPAKADPQAAAKSKTPPKPTWAASAPGRVESVGGEVRIGAQVPGRIAEVLVSLNDKVAAGDILARLDDEELIGRVNSAVAEAAVRKRERDNTEATGKPAQDRRTADDAVASAERQLVVVREEVDRLLKAKRGGSGDEPALEKARDAVNKAKEKLEQARASQRKALAADNLPAPSRPEAALVAARAELSVVDAALERTRVRAPSAGTVLQANVKAGETVAPSPENVLFVIGNLTSLQVRAEIEERDIGKVRVGQGAVIRSDAYPGKDFEGRVASLAQSLGPSKIGQRGPRRPTDVDVLEVLIDLAGQPPLLPGMRVDVFLRPEATAAPGSALIQQSANDTGPRSN
jgi:HlyD family secretion protein